MDSEQGNGAIKRRRLLEKIAMLCQTGAGIHAIASPFCAAMREIVDADAGLLVWLGPDGQPAGFYHETAPPEIKDLFITRFEDLFNSGEEISAASLINGRGPAVGKMLGGGMQQAFERGNVYRHLCAPLGHHYLLDVAVPRRAAYFAFNGPDRPFERRHAKAAEPILPWMSAALAPAGEPVQWHSCGAGGAHLIASLDGLTLLAIDDAAERLLRQSHLLRQSLSMLNGPREAPGFVRMLAATMADADSGELSVPVPDGRLRFTARRTRFLKQGNAEESSALMVSVDLQIARDIVLIEYLFARRLTAMQRQVALHAMQGKPRSECGDRLGVGAEALKKHLQAIYRESQVDRWDSLAELGPAIVADRAASIARASLM